MNKHSPSKIFLAVAGVIAAFKIAEGAFWLMSQRSTMFNISGLLLLASLTISISILLIKKQKQNEK
jgi:hypothetical protein